MATFTADVFQNEYLPEGSTEVHAVVSVTCADAGAAGRTGQGEAAEMILIDTSGSMDMPSAKIVAAREPPRWPWTRSPTGRCSPWSRGTPGTQMHLPVPAEARRMDPTSRAEAQRPGRSRSAPSGATTIGAWINSIRELFQGASASQSHAILLTDGKQEGSRRPSSIGLSRRPRACSSATAVAWATTGRSTNSDASRPRCWGRSTSSPNPTDMEADFEQIIRDRWAGGWPKRSCASGRPRAREILFVRQVAPTLEDLSDRAVPVTNLIREYPTGAWGDESRDYHVAVRVPAAPVGSERLAARVEVVVATRCSRRRWCGRSGAGRRPDHPDQPRRRPLHRTGGARRRHPGGTGGPPDRRRRHRHAPAGEGREVGPRQWQRATHTAAGQGRGDRRPRHRYGATPFRRRQGGRDGTRHPAAPRPSASPGRPRSTTLHRPPTRVRTDRGVAQRSRRNRHRGNEHRGSTVTTRCPNGHESTDPDWCDTCGAPLRATSAPITASVPSAFPRPAPDPAPSAGTPGVTCDHCERAEQPRQPVLRELWL